MAPITYVFTIDHVAKKLGEDPELLQAIVSNDDNLGIVNLSDEHTNLSNFLSDPSFHAVEDAQKRRSR